MNWQNGMANAMDYIEEHLQDIIDLSAVAQCVPCSSHEFCRLFSFITGIPISEYIRRRRLTEAGREIQAGAAILDTALRYGYESQSAFSRAFRNWHGVTPASTRELETMLRPFPRLDFRLVLMDEKGRKDTSYRNNIIGAGQVGYGHIQEEHAVTIHETNRRFWEEGAAEYLGAISLPKYGAFLSEESCHLLGDLTGQKILEIGCGAGESLCWMRKQGARELWGLDISPEQLRKAEENLRNAGASAKLILSPMEEGTALPQNYFDCVVSIYGIGWSTNLLRTFRRIFDTLKPGGTFVFSWSHPIHKCVAIENDLLLWKKSYFDERWYQAATPGGTLSLSDRKLSTYLNALAETGFILEKLVEESEDALLAANPGAFAEKAKQVPATFVVKTRKYDYGN